MKVNISGRGRVPGIGTLAPVRGYDASKEFVLRLLNYKQFKVFDAASGGLITKTNVDKLFAPKVEEAAPVEKPVVKKSTKSKKAKKVEAPVEEKPAVVEEDIPSESVQEPVIEDVNTEPVLVGVDVAQTEDVVVEAPVVADVTEEEVTGSFVADVEAVEDQLPETTEDTPAEDTPTEEEETSEEKPAYYSKKKNKKNRNRNNNNE